MAEEQKQKHQSYPWEGKIRNRVSGLMIRNRALLMVLIQLPYQKKPVWMPPGGGVRYGETLQECLVREFREETQTDVEPGNLKYIHEVRTDHLHAIEFYFYCRAVSGMPALGNDPEYKTDQQILKDIQFIPLHELKNLRVLPEFLRERLPVDWQTNNHTIEYINPY